MSDTDSQTMAALFRNVAARGAMIVGLAAFIGSPLPMALRLLGVLPDSEDFVFWFVFITGVIDTGLIICFQILVASMMADLVDQSELKTGRRSEGVFFAASTFIRKQHEENLRKLVAVNADKNQ